MAKAIAGRLTGCQTTTASDNKDHKSIIMPIGKKVNSLVPRTGGCISKCAFSNILTGIFNISNQSALIWKPKDPDYDKLRQVSFSSINIEFYDTKWHHQDAMS